MTKVKVFSTIFLSIILFGMSLFVAGCPSQYDKPNSCDVLICVSCREVDDNGRYDENTPTVANWIFNIGTDEIYVECEYDGKQYEYYVSQYYFAGLDGKGGKWFDADVEGPHAFATYFEKEDGQIVQFPYGNYTREKGNYCLTVVTSGSAHLWKDRTVKLYITVK